MSPAVLLLVLYLVAGGLVQLALFDYAQTLAERLERVGMLEAVAGRPLSSDPAVMVAIGVVLWPMVLPFFYALEQLERIHRGEPAKGFALLLEKRHRRRVERRVEERMRADGWDKAPCSFGCGSLQWFKPGVHGEPACVPCLEKRMEELDAEAVWLRAEVDG